MRLQSGTHLQRPASTKSKLSRDAQQGSATMTIAEQAASPPWFRIWDGKSYNIVVSSAKQSWCTESSMTSSTFLLRTTLLIPAHQPEATGPDSWYLTAPWMPKRAPSFPQQYVFGTLCLSPQLQHCRLMPSRAASALDQPSKPDKMFLTCF